MFYSVMQLLKVADYKALTIELKQGKIEIQNKI